jgi:hypothetical protein
MSMVIDNRNPQHREDREDFLEARIEVLQAEVKRLLAENELLAEHLARAKFAEFRDPIEAEFEDNSFQCDDCAKWCNVRHGDPDKALFCCVCAHGDSKAAFEGCAECEHRHKEKNEQRTGKA